jgi:uncharacterized membrane protein YjjB (DUF3815 family)
MKDDIAVIPYIIIFGFINCNAAPIKKLPELLFVSCSLEGKKVFMIKYTIYAAPNIFIGSCIFGIIVYKTEEKIKHRSITKKKPAKIPKLNIMPFLKPTFLALFMDIILFGPGV